MANIISYGRALYYPYINFKDERWLKTAALYYKGLNRIYPSAFHNWEDIDIVKRLNEKEEFIRNIDPTKKEKKIATDFLDFAKNQLLVDKYRKPILKKLSSKISSENPTFFISPQKVAPSLGIQLSILGLATKESFPELGEEYFHYNFEPVTGAFYMSCLANQMAQKDNIPVVTDDPIFQPFIKDIQAEKYKGGNDVGQVLASLVIQSVVPENIEVIPISKIIKFRESYEDERHLFYNEINKLVKDLEMVDSKTALYDCLEAKKKDIKIAVKNLDKSFKGMGISTATAMLGLSIPSFASGLDAGIAAAGVVAIAVGKLLSQGIEYYKSKNSSPYSYVLSLKHKLKSETFAEQLLKGKILI